jgi:hypothetical protein
MTFLLTTLQDLQEQADINDTLRTQLAQAKTESAEKGSVRPPSPLSLSTQLVLTHNRSSSKPKSSRCGAKTNSSCRRGTT